MNHTIGIIAHAVSEKPILNGLFRSAAQQWPDATVDWHQVSTVQGEPFTSQARQSVIQQTADIVTNGHYGLIALEANLGNAAGPITFDTAFFNRFPSDRFVLFYGEGVDAQSFNAAKPDNVLALLRKPLQVRDLTQLVNARFEEGPGSPADTQDETSLDRAFYASSEEESRDFEGLATFPNNTKTNTGQPITNPGDNDPEIEGE
ncbi:MAG: hypothetical protein JO197_08495 [Acidobacteria bacterium]|nr:hypothetical protein [Acidobacteriota bacterium]MBV9474659.1 hypothetical protein [Acidobacteriota bacterium]